MGPAPLQSVAIVGPTFPSRGGIAQHTTELAHRLSERVEVVELASWVSQGPRYLTRDPGPLRTPESVLFPRVTRDLHWSSPGSWSRVGHRLGGRAAALVLVMTAPLQFPALSTIARRFRARRASDPARIVMIIHNVLPHEWHPGSRWVASRALRIPDRVIVHSVEQARVAEELGAGHVTVATLPLHGPRAVSSMPPEPSTGPARHLAFFGFVRPYKGLEDLLRALSLTRTQPRLTVMGEFWEPVQRYRRLIREHGLGDRVSLRPGYASDSDVSSLLLQSDALVLPYRSATGSQMPRLAFSHGTPVLTTDAGDLGTQVRHGIDGFVFPANDPEALAAAIDALYSDDMWRRLRSGTRRPSEDIEWIGYVDGLLAGLHP